MHIFVHTYVMINISYIDRCIFLDRHVIYFVYIYLSIVQIDISYIDLLNKHILIHTYVMVHIER